jgi:hypothetical protein
LPLASTVPVWRARAARIAPVAVKAPLAASYVSAEPRRNVPSSPPLTRTAPPGSSMAWWDARVAFMFPVAAKAPSPGS